MGETTASGEGGGRERDRCGVAGVEDGGAEIDLHRTARHVHAGPVAGELPIMGRGGRRARTSSAGGGGADAALVDHHLDLAWLAGGDDLDVRATGGGGVDPGADLEELVEAGERLAAPVPHQVGVADVDVNSAEDVSPGPLGQPLADLGLVHLHRSVVRRGGQECARTGSTRWVPTSYTQR